MTIATRARRSSAAADRCCPPVERRTPAPGGFARRGGRGRDQGLRPAGPGDRRDRCERRPRAPWPRPRCSRRTHLPRLRSACRRRHLAATVSGRRRPLRLGDRDHLHQRLRRTPRPAPRATPTSGAWSRRCSPRPSATIPRRDPRCSRPGSSARGCRSTGSSPGIARLVAPALSPNDAGAGGRRRRRCAPRIRASKVATIDGHLPGRRGTRGRRSASPASPRGSA